MMLIINILNGLISILFIGMGIFIAYSKWGAISQYLFGTGIILILLGGNSIPKYSFFFSLFTQTIFLF